MNDSYRRWAVGTMALLLAGLGLALLFAGDVLGPQLVAAGGGPLTSLWGVALFGFAMAIWIAKGAILGGIYGHAVVVGNQVDFFGGALILLTSAGVTRDGPVFWVVAGVYVLGAALFTYLMMSSGVTPRRFDRQR